MTGFLYQCLRYVPTFYLARTSLFRSLNTLRFLIPDFEPLPPPLFPSQPPLVSACCIAVGFLVFNLYNNVVRVALRSTEALAE